MMANGTISPAFHMRPAPFACPLFPTGGCASLTRPTCQNKSTVMGVVLLRLKKSAPQGRFPPGAGIAKGAAASPLCTFA
ncbi:hypothetical protein FZI36_21175 [Cronobacter sakazakii]|nr:hypothetical protein FZI27_09725 [Cronobacter sakazakii]KAB2162626.1 hypothetical protein FZI36_21175 [Cronobacter sakazakii]KAB2169322.1 hypothetical protein FZI34_01680 [Cronobacter sakazakii]MCI0187217.1 hypothetical protein [Cronobacter sakazakii]